MECQEGLSYGYVYLATDRETHSTKRRICIWGRVTRAFDWKESSGPEPRAKRSKLSAPGTGNSILSSNILHQLPIWTSAYRISQVRHILNDKKKLKRVIDPEMGRSSYTMESVAMFANLASRCIRVESHERPSMTECIKELQLILYINSKGLGMTMHALRMKWNHC